MIEAYYIYYALYFYYYHISSTSDHQALDPEVGELCFSELNLGKTWGGWSSELFSLVPQSLLPRADRASLWMTEMVLSINRGLLNKDDFRLLPSLSPKYLEP